jgi:hypothetical protein
VGQHQFHLFGELTIKETAEKESVKTSATCS